MRNPSPTSLMEKCEFSLSGMIADYRRNLGRVGKMGTPSILQIFSPSIPDDREYLQFLVFISRQSLGQSGNSKIPDCQVFSDIYKLG